MKHRWHLEYHPDVEDQLAKLPQNIRMAVFASIEELLKAENPKSVQGVIKLVNAGDIYRQRQGDYRIMFEVETGKVVYLKSEYVGKVNILAVLHRSKVYKPRSLNR